MFAKIFALVENVGLEPLSFIPNEGCYHYTTFSKFLLIEQKISGIK